MTYTVVDGLATDSLPVTDRGVAYGHGLFETMLLHQGVLPLRQQHCERLLRDAPTLGINISAQQVEETIDSLIQGLSLKQCQSGIVKTMVTAGSGGRGYASPTAAEAAPRVIAQYFPLPQDIQLQRQQGVSLTECVYPLPLNPVLAGIKHLNRLDQVMARSEWAEEYDDGLMFSAGGELIETTRANIFIKLSSGWVTPRLNQAGVRGVMRELLLDKLFAGAGLEVRQDTISPEQLANGSELFSCSSVRGIVPVTSTPSIGSVAIGSETRLLQRQLQKSYQGFPC